MSLGRDGGRRVIAAPNIIEPPRAAASRGRAAPLCRLMPAVMPAYAGLRGSMAGKGPRALPAGITDSLSAAEQAHLDSGGVAALEAAPDSTTSSTASSTTSPEPEAAAPAAEPASPERAAAEPEAAAPEAPAERTKMVPHASLHEEREARKAAEKRAQLLEERTNLLLQSLGPRAAEPAKPAESGPELVPVPPFSPDNAAEHIIARLHNSETVARVLLPIVAQIEHGSVTRQQAAEVSQRIAAIETDFARDNPDYGEARNFTIAQLERQLVAGGYRDPGQRQAMIRQHAFNMVDNAVRQGLNPAAAAYEFARALGYQKPGAAAAPPARPAGATPAARIANAAAGQRQAGPLGSLRGSGPAPLTTQRLLELSDAEFARAIATPEGRALLGA
jgi:hypothetical protein